MNNKHLPNSYHAYLLRYWAETDATWRFSLEAAQSGEQIGFADLSQLVAFLQEQMVQAEEKNPDPIGDNRFDSFERRR